MRNTFEQVLLKLELLIVTTKCRKSRGHFKTNKEFFSIWLAPLFHILKEWCHTIGVYFKVNSIEGC